MDFDPTKIPGVYGQALIAILLLLSGLLSTWHKYRLEKREEAREANRIAEAEEREKKQIAREEKWAAEQAAHREEDAKRQAVIADNLAQAQRLVTQHGELLDRKIEKVHRDLEANTEINVKAIETANGYNEKIATLAEMVSQSPAKVEIVQPADNPIPVKFEDDVVIGGDEKE